MKKNKFKYSIGICLIAILSLISFYCEAQRLYSIKILDKLNHNVLPHVNISEGDSTLGFSDEFGTAKMLLTENRHRLVFSLIGFDSLVYDKPLNYDTLITVELVSNEQKLDEVIVIASSRNNQRIESSPLKVEVLGNEELHEENTIKPANIASLIGDISGIQIQQTSVTSGNINVRIQGLDGKYTQILRDGMPLFDGFSGGFGILSIPPLDLRQIELIKGSASTLFGGGAIGGLINVISKKPSQAKETIFSINRSSLKESNLNLFISRRLRRTGFTFYGGVNHQEAVDVNRDGFSDVGKLSAMVVHPKLFFYPGDSATISIGYTGTFEKRRGGDMQVLSGKMDSMHQYFEDNHLIRHTVDALIERKMNKGKMISLKASVSNFNRAITGNDFSFHGGQLNYFSELSILIPKGKNNVVAGINFNGLSFHPQLSDSLLLRKFYGNTLGFFVQKTIKLPSNTLLEAGLRNDIHSQYGNFLLPRLSLFQKINSKFGLRAGVGMGYKIPSPLEPQLIDYALDKIKPMGANVRAEKSVGYNAEINYLKRWSSEMSLFFNHAFFYTAINHPISAKLDAIGLLTFQNESKPTVSKGFDTYLRFTWDDWELYAGITYTIAERKYESGNQFVPLTPKLRMAYTLTKEWEGKWRIGLEGSFTGKQYRFDFSKTPSYYFMAAMVERKFGKHIGLVLNGENLLNYRQSKTEALYSGTNANPTFKAIWGPIEGRVINVSCRVKL